MLSKRKLKAQKCRNSVCMRIEGGLERGGRVSGGNRQESKDTQSWETRCTRLVQYNELTDAVGPWIMIPLRRVGSKVVCSQPISLT